MKQKNPHLLIVGNWKMNPTTLSNAEMLLKDILVFAKRLHNTSLWLAVPSIFTAPLVKQSKEVLQVGVQNIHSEEDGAHTGDISGTQAASCGARFTILGHSERRALGETNQDIQKKINAAFKQKLSVVLCVGENVRDNDGHYLEEIKSQVKEALLDIDVKHIKNLVIAYEPVWAIGKNATGVATPHESLEVSILIRRTLQDLYSEVVAKKVIILYGGSANSENARGFVEDGGAQGFLLGRASLDASELKTICALYE